ncbi:hypothetical protein C6558_36015 [Ensifer sp. NM-2]|nr:hypothetical protein C6558_36015 [Ensifer sp. NM-2]
MLAEPTGEEKISGRALAYVSQTAKDNLFDLVTRAFIEAGISRATLAKRLGKDPSQVTRLMTSSGNWTVETCAEILFAINGAFLRFDEHWPQKLETENESWSPTCFLTKQVTVVVHSKFKLIEYTDVQSVPPLTNTATTVSVKWH